MDIEGIGRLLLIAGLGIVALGGLFMLASRLPFLRSFGSLPGDVRIQVGSVTCFSPIVSMIILSIVLTIALNLAARFLSR